MAGSTVSFFSGYKEQSAKYRYQYLRAYIFVLLLTILPKISSAQANANNALLGTVEGQITCNDGGFPARGAKVNLFSLPLLLSERANVETHIAGEQGQNLQTTTDFEGRFQLSHVQTGTYVVVARLGGYSRDFEIVQRLLKTAKLERQRELLSAFPQIVVRPGSIIRQDLVLRRGGAITGRITSDTGGPLSSALVSVKMVSGNLIGNREGGEDLKPIDLWSARGMTDDRGVYRIAGLPAGKYQVAVRVGESAKNVSAGLVTVYPPEALAEAEAKPIEIDEGDELSNIDINIPLHRLHSISGVILLHGGTPIAGVPLTIQHQGEKGNIEFISGADGSYRIDLLQSGNYVIEASNTPANQRNSSSSTRRKITVQLGESDILDANIELP